MQTFQHLCPLPIGDDEASAQVDEHYRMYCILVQARRALEVAEVPGMTEEEKLALMLDLVEVFRFLQAPETSVQDIGGRRN